LSNKVTPRVTPYTIDLPNMGEIDKIK